MLAVGTLEPRKNLARVVEATARAGVAAAARRRVRLGRGGRRAAPRQLARPDRRRRAGGGLSRRSLSRLPLALRGLRDPGARGDGVRHAGRDECRRARWRRSSATPAVLVDPLDVASIAAGIDEADRRRDELVPAGLERARLFTWERAVAAAVAGYRAGAADERAARRRRRGRARPAPHGRRDLRARTCCASCGALDSGLRIAAVTRHPELVPEGIEPLELRTPLQEARMLWTLPRLLRRAGAALVHTQYAVPFARAVPGRRHDPRPLVRARPARTCR